MNEGMADAVNVSPDAGSVGRGAVDLLRRVSDRDRLARPGAILPRPPLLLPRVPAIEGDRRPLGLDGRKRRRDQARIRPRGVDGLAADDREHALDPLDVL